MYLKRKDQFRETSTHWRCRYSKLQQAQIGSTHSGQVVQTFLNICFKNIVIMIFKKRYWMEKGKMASILNYSCSFTSFYCLFFGPVRFVNARSPLWETQEWIVQTHQQWEKCDQVRQFGTKSKRREFRICAMCHRISYCCRMYTKHEASLRTYTAYSPTPSQPPQLLHPFKLQPLQSFVYPFSESN